MKKRFYLLLLSSLLFSMETCNSYNGLTRQQYRDARLKNLRTRRQDALKKLGEPYYSTESSTGSVTMIIDQYPSTVESSRIMNYVPYAGYYEYGRGALNAVGENFMLTLTYRNGVLMSQNLVKVKN